MENYVKPRPIFPKRAVITGGMPYGNKNLHLGHIALMLRADTFARFMRDRIGKENVIFVSGTDCYGSPAVEAFRKLTESGNSKFKTIEDFIMANHKAQKKNFEDFEVSLNLFGASALGKSKKFHADESEYFIKTLYKSKSISKQSSLQFYDKKFAQFLNGRQVIGKCPVEGCQSEKGYADECDLGHQYLPQDLINPISTLSGEKPILKNVENWYFNLENYLDLVKNWIDDISTKTYTSQFMVKEMREFFKKPEIYIKKEYKNVVLSLNLPNYHIEGKDTAPSFTLVFDKLTDREKACEILAENGVRYRTGKTLTPFRLTGDLDWGVPCPVIEGLSNRTFYVWPESLWAPISFTRTYLDTLGKPKDEWKKFWCCQEACVYQFIGEDNMYFYGPAQAAMWLCTQGTKPVYPAPQGCLQVTNIVPIKHLLFMDKKASSSGAIKPPSAQDILDHYTPEQFRMHVLGMNLGNNSASFCPKALNPDAKAEDADPALKEGNLLTNVYNRILRTVFYSTQKAFSGNIPLCPVDEQVMEDCKKAILDYERFMYDKKFHQVINVVDVFVRNINKFWVKNINECTDNEGLSKLIANVMQYIITANYLLHPMAPSGTEKVKKYLNLNDKMFDWQFIFDDYTQFLTNPASPKLKTLKEKEDFFKKHQSQLDELANKTNEK